MEEISVSPFKQIRETKNVGFSLFPQSFHLILIGQLCLALNGIQMASLIIN